MHTCCFARLSCRRPKLLALLSVVALAPMAAPADLFQKVKVVSQVEGTPGNDHSGLSGIAMARAKHSDGHTYESPVFETRATNLVPGDVNGVADLVRVGENGLVLLTRGYDGSPANGASRRPRCPGAGIVVFESDASNLVEGDTNGRTDVFLVNVDTGRITSPTVPLRPNGRCFTPAISGRHLAFVSEADNLVPGDTNGVADVFVMRLDDPNSLTLVSRSESGAPANGMSRHPSVADDGEGFVVAFETLASNLTPLPDTNRLWDVVYRSASGTLTCASRPPLGESNGNSLFPDVYPGSVRFLSDASNLIPDDTNGVRDAFRWDHAGELDRISRSWQGRQLDGRTIAYAGGLLVTNARNGSEVDTTPGSELLRMGGSHVLTTPYRIFYGPGWVEPRGNISAAAWLFPGVLVATDASNCNGGSPFSQVVYRAPDHWGNLYRVVSRPATGQGRGNEFAVLGQEPFLGWSALARIGNLAQGWVVLGSNSINRGYLGIDLYVAHPGTRQLGVWKLDGTRAAGWRSLGVLPEGWVPEVVVTTNFKWQNSTMGLVARRTSDQMVTISEDTGGTSLGPPTVLGRIAGRFVGDGHYNYEPEEYSIAWYDPVTRKVGGVRIHPTLGLRWQSVRGTIAPGWRVVMGRIYNGRENGAYDVERESDGRGGAYLLDRAAFTGWQTHPAIPAGWRWERTIFRLLHD